MLLPAVAGTGLNLKGDRLAFDQRETQRGRLLENDRREQLAEEGVPAPVRAGRTGDAHAVGTEVIGRDAGEGEHGVRCAGHRLAF